MVAFINIANPLGSGTHPGKCVADGPIGWVKLELLETSHGDPIWGVDDPINSKKCDIHLHPSNYHHLSTLFLTHVCIKFSYKT